MTGASQSCRWVELLNGSASQMQLQLVIALSACFVAGIRPDMYLKSMIYR